MESSKKMSKYRKYKQNRYTKYNRYVYVLFIWIPPDNSLYHLHKILSIHLHNIQCIVPKNDKTNHTINSGVVGRDSSSPNIHRFRPSRHRIYRFVSGKNATGFSGFRLCSFPIRVSGARVSMEARRNESMYRPNTRIRQTSRFHTYPTYTIRRNYTNNDTPIIPAKYNPHLVFRQSGNPKYRKHTISCEDRDVFWPFFPFV